MQKVLKRPYSLNIKNYLTLTKPGIIFGNLITAAAGFALASQKQINVSAFLIMLIGLTFVIASACICNNYIDRELDGKMARTKKRPLVQGVISNKSALTLATFLLIAGLFVISNFVNYLAAISSIFGFVGYVFLYSFSKYQTSLGTLIGSFSGAVPPVVGYCAASAQLDLAALLIFLVIAMWQMPHFYAIAIYRLKDYAKGAIPVLPIHKGMHRTKVHMAAYVVAFILASYSLSFFQFTNQVFGISMTVLGLIWLILSFKGFKASNDTVWARKMFIFSLVIIMAQSVMISVCVNN